MQKQTYAEAAPHLTGQRTVIFQDSCTIADILTVRHIGGHTAGACIALLPTDKTVYVFCGDECYLTQCLTEHRPTGMSQRPAVSRQFIDTYSADIYTPLTAHDPSNTTKRILEKRYI